MKYRNSISERRDARDFPQTSQAAAGTRRGTTLLAIGAALAASALWVRHQTQQAERQYPPRGQFIEVDGVRLHYIERGTGQPLLLLHGNGSMAEDLELSGWVDLAAKQYRVIVFDRPGFGYSERPRDKAWTPSEQAQLLHRALEQLGIEETIVVGHSWGTLVALALALDYPDSVRSLVLVSGYYYPSLRIDAMLTSIAAMPVIGDVLRHTLSPVVGRLAWPALARRVFGPPDTPARFAAFPVWLALRPSQLRAIASEGRLMVPAAKAFAHRYRELRVPVAIVAGSDDRMADTHAQSERLHQEIPHSTLHLIPSMGHMLYYFNAPEIMAAIAAAPASVEQAGKMRPPPQQDRVLH